MDIDPTACVTMVLDRREMSPDLSQAGHNGPRARITTVPDCQASPQQHRYYEHLLSGYSAALTSRATRLMHRYRVHDPAFSADDAVQHAALKLLQAHNEGKIRAPDTDDDFVRLFLHKLDQMVRQEREREGRSKRGGQGASHDHPVRVVVHCGAELDSLPAHSPPPEDWVIAEDALDRLLGILDAQDPCLHAVAMGMAHGLTHQEIATQLGHSLCAIHEKVRRIRAILSALARA